MRHRSGIPQLLCAIALAAASSACPQASAELTLLVGEPFGSFGTMMPSGHTTIYLDRVCADGPSKLRMCRPGEPRGVAVARYNQIGVIDWIATPIMQFLYATDIPADIPAYATASMVWEMRERYRERYLRSIVPDGAERAKATSEWWETAGVGYNRKFWGYSLATTVEQDEAFVRAMNADGNSRRYKLSDTNCADFAADSINFYFPGAVHRNKVADFGWMSPKQVARSVETYGETHPDLNMQVFEVPQIPGSLRRSRPVRGAAETLLKTKRYLATLLVIQPEVVAVAAILYLDRGRWRIGQGAEPVAPASFAGNPASLTQRDPGPPPCASGARDCNVASTTH